MYHLFMILPVLSVCCVVSMFYGCEFVEESVSGLRVSSHINSLSVSVSDSKLISDLNFLMINCNTDKT